MPGAIQPNHFSGPLLFGGACLEFFTPAPLHPCTPAVQYPGAWCTYNCKLTLIPGAFKSPGCNCQVRLPLPSTLFLPSTLLLVFGNSPPAFPQFLPVLWGPLQPSLS